MVVCRETGVITGQAVMEERNQVELQKFVDNLPLAMFYCTDGFKNYQELVWPEGSEHLISVQKERTHTIESINAELRTYLGRLKRRSRCFSLCLNSFATSYCVICVVLQPTATQD